MGDQYGEVPGVHDRARRGAQTSVSGALGPQVPTVSTPAIRVEGPYRWAGAMLHRRGVGRSNQPEPGRGGRARAQRDAIVWIDADEATVLTFDLTTSTSQLVSGSKARRALWRMTRTDGACGDDIELFEAVVAAIHGLEHVVVAGPDAAAAAFVAFVGAHAAALTGVVTGPEPIQSATQAAMLAYGRARLLRGRRTETAVAAQM
jgi:hypothetical protein